MPICGSLVQCHPANWNDHHLGLLWCSRGAADLWRQEVAPRGRQPSAERLVLASRRSGGDERADGRLPTVGRWLDVLIRDSGGAPHGSIQRARPGAGCAGHVLRAQSPDLAGLEQAPQLLLRIAPAKTGNAPVFLTAMRHLVWS